MTQDITVINTNKKFRLNERFIGKIARRILEILKKHDGMNFEFIFLNDGKMRQFNRRYKNRGTNTDVLSFDLGSFGQIFISSDTALKNSRVFNTTFEKELILYVIHGILHLSGYDDTTIAKRKRMSKKESEILKRLCDRSNFSRVLMPR